MLPSSVHFPFSIQISVFSPVAVNAWMIPPEGSIPGCFQRDVFYIFELALRSYKSHEEDPVTQGWNQ